MTPSNSFWNAYAQFQSRLSRRTVLDSRSWGLDEALSASLVSDAASETEIHDHLLRTAASAARKHRKQRNLLIQQDKKPSYSNTSDELADLQQQLECLATTLAESPDASLLIAVADGHGYDDLAVRFNRSCPESR